ncbi:uncharacterized protein DC041_0007101 [Schistosoma bovis]|nr:uncharacterized protein DC041_0007101 [Schistosoma bovis]
MLLISVESSFLLSGIHSNVFIVKKKKSQQY